MTSQASHVLPADGGLEESQDDRRLGKSPEAPTSGPYQYVDPRDTQLDNPMEYLHLVAEKEGHKHEDNEATNNIDTDDDEDNDEDDANDDEDDDNDDDDDDDDSDDDGNANDDNKRPFPCEIDGCNRRFKWKKDLVRHQDSFAAHRNENTTTMIYYCRKEDCSRAEGGNKAGFPRLDSLQRHMKGHCRNKSQSQEH